MISSFDPPQWRVVREACKKGGMAAVVVTHDAQLATWAGRSVFLRDGEMTVQPATAAARAGERQ